MDNFNIHKFYKNQYLNEGENDGITKSNISNLDYEGIKNIFPEISTRNRISFPNPDDSLRGVGNERDWEDWKKDTMGRYGDVELEMDPNNSMWFKRVKINDDKFKKDKDQFIKGKQSFIDREQSLGRSIDENHDCEKEHPGMSHDEYVKKQKDIDTIKMMNPKTDTKALKQIVKDLIAKRKKGIEEGTCGYTPDGKPRSKPASPVGKGNKIEENTRTRELADSYSLAELKSRLAQIYRDMEEEAEPEGGPVADQYADEIDAYEKAIRLKKGDSGREMTYGDMLHKTQPDKYGPGGVKRFSTVKPDRDSFEKSSKFDRGIGEGQKIGATSYKTRTAINTAPGKTEDKEVMIDNTDDLNNITIRWRGANHHGNKTLTNLKFTKESEFDEDLMAFSNDSKWLFIVDLDEETGEPDWDTLMVDNRELENVDDDGNSTYKVPDEDMINESEDKWNAIDVSRKAEKELSNKEWNERTAKKLEMLMKLNAAGKFKKDFDEERLQGWIDKNYSWEKLSQQFKLNESKNWSEKFKPIKEKLNNIEKSLPETMKSSGRINREES